ncbi:phage major capsid protein [Blastococcus sp. TF02A-26]|uniref:phage major capsid protein n=1 Tax=Blastococcus sp. TF02A-26 TaxID=2250577 RepID=UPI000DEABE62|nr:phage major capsid protein [Blastococcus sp. TF02A-26]RBY82669.1 phage major capsid protein [Blastococcus sp. TF02A-26]
MTPDQYRERIREALAQRTIHENTVSTVRAAIGTGEPTEAQATQLREARAAVAAVDAQIDQLSAGLNDALEEERREARAAELRRELVPAGETRTERPAGGARVTSEERTYTAHKSSRGEVSFFVDLYRMSHNGDLSARARLERHGQEVVVEGEGMSERAASTGSFAGLVAPQYLVDLAAPVLRSGRPVANAVQGLPLPEQGMVLTIPRGTTGASAASQTAENAAVSNTDQVYTDLQVPVRTIAGQQDISRQSLERGSPGLDELTYLDLAAAYHAELDRQVVNGSGTGNQMLGMLQTTGRLIAAAYGAAITPGLFNLKVAGAIANMAGAGTRINPNLIIAAARRWGWLTGQMDSAGRPLVVPGVGGPMNVLALNTNPGAYGGGSGDGTDTESFVTPGSLQGLPLVTDGNVPTNIGTNVEDVAFVVDRSQCLLWEEGDRQPRQLRFDQTGGGSLTVKLVVYGYAAFTSGRYPGAVAQIGGVDATAGQGQVAPTF